MKLFLQKAIPIHREGEIGVLPFQQITIGVPPRHERYDRKVDPRRPPAPVRCVETLPGSAKNSKHHPLASIACICFAIAKSGCSLAAVVYSLILTAKLNDVDPPGLADRRPTCWLARQASRQAARRTAPLELGNRNTAQAA
jgi:hypothetical protein